MNSFGNIFGAEPLGTATKQQFFMFLRKMALVSAESFYSLEVGFTQSYAGLHFQISSPEVQAEVGFY